MSVEFMQLEVVLQMGSVAPAGTAICVNRGPVDFAPGKYWGSFGDYIGIVNALS